MFTIITTMFPFLKSVKFWVILGTFILITLGSIGLYNSHISLVEDLATEIEKSIALEATIANREGQIVKLNDDIVVVVQAHRTTQKKKEQIETEAKRLERKLIKDGRDIGFMMLKKPDAMERIFNRGIEQRLRCIAVVSGSEVKPDEQNLSKSQRNNVCPRLFGYTD